VQTLTEIRSLLESRGLRPRKAFGQNFLIDHNLIRKLVDASGIRAGDLVLEVGPGTGTLTEELLARDSRVIACELDHNLAGLLRERLAAPIAEGRLTVIEGDCLESKRGVSREVQAALDGKPFTLVANLPYNAATPLMLALLCEHPECRGFFVTIQREVADRLLADPGTRDYGPVSVVARAVGEPKLLASLPPECFWPRPDVNSAMISLTRRAMPLTNAPRALADFCQVLFSQRRKQLGSVLGRSGPWPGGVEPTDRAERLTVPQILELLELRIEPPPATPHDRVA